MESFPKFDDSQVYFAEYCLNFVNEQNILQILIIHLHFVSVWILKLSLKKNRKKQTKLRNTVVFQPALYITKQVES